MPRVRIDIKTRLIPDDHRCYILFPGEGYRLYRDIKDQSAVFLDIPGFPVAPNENLLEARDLPQRLILSERVKEWHARGRPDEEQPARLVADLGRYRVTTAKRQAAGLVRGFLSSLKPGDVVIVPGRDLEDDVLFGEIIGDGLEPLRLRRYGDDLVPARRVRWVKAIRRYDIPQWLERKIPSPNPLRQIERQFFSSIFDIMYERYLFDGKFVCKFNIAAEEFSALDNFLFQQIVLYVSALHEARFEGNIDDLRGDSIASVASRIEFSEDIPDQRIFVNSPGHIVLYSRNLIPIIAGAFLVLSSTGQAGAPAADIQVEIVNTGDQGALSDECVAEVQAEVNGDLEAMGYVRWQQLCQIAMRARERTDLDSGMNATIRR